MKTAYKRVILIITVIIPLMLLYIVCDHYYIVKTTREERNINSIKKFYEFIALEFDKNIYISKLEGFYNDETDEGGLLAVLEFEREYYNNNKLNNSYKSMDPRIKDYDNILADYGYYEKSIDYASIKFQYINHAQCFILDNSVGRLPYSIRFYIMYPILEKNTVTVVALIDDNVPDLKVNVEQVMEDQERLFSEMPTS